MASRTTERQGYDVPTRFLLAERDLDEHETTLDQINDRVGKIVTLTSSILASLCVACILLALNLAVK